jgi:hypothetical protein
MTESERPVPARALREAFDAMACVAQQWFEQHRPFIQALAEFAARPEVRAAVEQMKARQAVRELRPCHCLCVWTHPAEKGICDMNGVTTLRFASEMTGPVEVPLCAPCAVAQGLAALVP